MVIFPSVIMLTFFLITNTCTIIIYYCIPYSISCSALSFFISTHHLWTVLQLARCDCSILFARFDFARGVMISLSRKGALNAHPQRTNRSTRLHTSMSENKNANEHISTYNRNATVMAITHWSR